MRRRIVNLLVFMALLFGMIDPLIAQQQDISQVNVNELSDEQIQRLIREMNARGLSLEQAVQIARARGATQLQIDQMTQRIREVQLNPDFESQKSSGKDKNMKGLHDDFSGFTGGMGLFENEDDENELSQKKQFLLTEAEKKIFGARLFNREDLTFEPSVNMALPNDYVLGIGDEVVIQVWGSSQQTY